MKLFFVLMFVCSGAFASGTINVKPQMMKEKETMSEKMESFMCKSDESLKSCMARFESKIKSNK